MPERRADWVVVGEGDAKMEDGKCLRCGRVFYMMKPVELEVWTAGVRAFVKVHRRCRPRPVEKPAA